MARRQPRELNRHLAAHSKEGHRGGLRLVCRGAGRQPVLWLDRWSETTRRSPELAAEVHTPQGSQRNRARVGELTDAGRMRPAGRRAVAEAKRSGKWGKAYASAATAGIPAD